MPIDLKAVSQLRERTGAGFGDCKSALEEASGDVEKAIEVLRKKGEIKAAKKAERATNEGVVSFARDGQKVAAVALACETDFVSRNEDFVKSVDGFASKLLTSTSDEFKSWVEETIKNELVVKIGENLKLIDFGVFSGEVVGTYLHFNKKSGAVVVLSGGNEELANELAMQITAMSPKYLEPANIPAAELDKEKEIYRESLKGENKPENIMEKIIEGKLAKYYEETCLLNQIYIRDDSKKISDLLKEAGAQVKEFKRFQI